MKKIIFLLLISVPASLFAQGIYQRDPSYGKIFNRIQIAPNSGPGSLILPVGDTIADTNVDDIRGSILFRTQDGDSTLYIVVPDANAASGYRFKKVGAPDGVLQSLSLSMPDIFTVSGSPATGPAGSISVNFINQSGTGSQGNFLGSPAGGGSGSVTFRGLNATDIPALSATKITSGVLTGERVGSGSPISGRVLVAQGTLTAPQWGVLSAADVGAIMNSTTPQTADFNITGTGNLDGILTIGGPPATDSFRLRVQSSPIGISMEGEKYNGSAWLQGGSLSISSPNIGLQGNVTVNGTFGTRELKGNVISPAVSPLRSSNFTATDSYTTYPIDNAGTDINVSLPSAATVPGRLYLFPISLGDGAAGLPVTIGGQSVILGSGIKGPLAMVQSNGTAWMFLQGF